MTLKQSSAVHIQALVSADGILPVSSSKLRLLVINLASVPGGQLVNSPTAQSLARCAKFQTSISLPMKIIEKAKILLEEYKFEELSKLLQNKSKKEVETLLFTIAYDDECLLVYTFINSLIQKHETAALHYLASHIMAFALNQLPNGYKIAYYHALKALELSPNDIELKNYILLFYSIPDKLLSREVALDYAKEVYDNDKNNNAARQVLELPLVSNK